MTTQTPKLRFPEFSDKWEVKKLGDLLEFKNGINADKEQYGSGAKFINVLDILNNDYITHDKIIGSVNVDNQTLEKYLVSYGDILFQRSSETREEVGTANVYLDETRTATFGGFVIRGKKIGEYNPVFLNKLLKTDSARDNITSKSGGSTRYNVGQEILSSVGLLFPQLPEQTKIANFLTAIDEKIQALKQKKTLLEQYKKGIMQRLFCLNGDSCDLYDDHDSDNTDKKSTQSKKSYKSRFRQDNGADFDDWEEKSLGEICKRIVSKNKEVNTNVLTISAQFGLISQLEFFNKSVSAKDVSGYYLLHKDDFAYNKSYSNGYPMGAIKRLKKYNKGVVSTLYICFRFEENIDLGFVEQYFESGIHNQEIEKVAQEGARNHGLLNIGLNDFFNTFINLPSLPEQQKIANFLTAIDEKIEKVSEQITATETYKKGLLQQMFF